MSSSTRGKRKVEASGKTAEGAESGQTAEGADQDDALYVIDEKTHHAITRALVACMNDTIFCFIRAYNLVRYIAARPGTVSDSDLGCLGCLAEAVMDHFEELRASLAELQPRSMHVLYSRMYPRGTRMGRAVDPVHALRRTAAETLQPLMGTSGQLLAENGYGGNISRYSDDLPSISQENADMSKEGVNITTHTQRVLETGRGCVALIETAADTLFVFSLARESRTAFQAALHSCALFVSKMHSTIPT